jgi:aspartate/methionine/tyrosine aminotransferase
VDTLRERRDLVVEKMRAIEGVHCYKPEASFYVYPNVTEIFKRKGFDNYETFRKTVLRETGVSFCTRLHFGRPLPGEDQFYIRLAFSGINNDLIEAGLSRLKDYLDG